MGSGQMFSFGHNCQILTYSHITYGMYVYTWTDSGDDWGHPHKDIKHTNTHTVNYLHDFYDFYLGGKRMNNI